MVVSPDAYNASTSRCCGLSPTAAKSGSPSIAAAHSVVTTGRPAAVSRTAWTSSARLTVFGTMPHTPARAAWRARYGSVSKLPVYTSTRAPAACSFSMLASGAVPSASSRSSTTTSGTARASSSSTPAAWPTNSRPSADARLASNPSTISAWSSTMPTVCDARFAGGSTTASVPVMR
ncbi:hypothetical protein [Tsukamurella sp. PLM1]|uniref:hypothetical protein n=1 Tax=Tsukamurella sp. PLM1 TaxID=2929795 RepID=UPI00353041B4